MVSQNASPLIVTHSDRGGQNVQVAGLAAALTRRGHDVVVYTRRHDPNLPTHVHAGSFEVVHVDAGPACFVGDDCLLPFRAAFAAGLAADWQERPPDVVHAHSWISGVAALDAAATARDRNHPMPVLQSFHGTGNVRRRHHGAADPSPRERAWLESAVARHADRILAITPDEIRELAAIGADMARVSVAPCGVDLDLFALEGPAERTGARRRIAAVGRLLPRTGLDLPIRALGRLASAGVADVELQIVGGSPAHSPARDQEARRLRLLAAELGVADRVVFRGPVPREQMPTFLRSCLALVVTPWYDSCGNAPLEAMAAGVPVVACAGVLQDVVVDGVTGLQVRPREAAALAAALRRLLDNPALRHRLGAGGRRRMEGAYSWEHAAALTESAYLDTLTAAGVGVGRLVAESSRRADLAS